MAIVRAENGKDFIRWIGHLKKEVNQNLSWHNDPINPVIMQQILDSEDNDASFPVHEEVRLPETPSSNLENQATIPAVDKSFNLRDRKLIKIPAKYLNCLLTMFD